ncbi:branched-chain amino acid ABC transporter [Rhizocola hellebori]|uniref:Branched-chain amino acid ABC transporter n=1 Tax=Rhizocola hellebori TaxID=1392758 RepID=A0A8J3QJE6_9ACTN|nr:ABC transporter substrate-binding protein [Rhizocola hellebori]GIH10819.1 branched-chain amino acid ABC transporter [Rhizocola hellebori]
MANGISRRRALTGGLGLAAGTTLGGGLAGCSRIFGGSQDGGAVNTSGELVVGVNLELTGVGSTLGKLQEQALIIAASELNINGIPFGDRRLAVRAIVRDNGGNPENAAQISQDFIDNDKVSAILGGTTVETAMAMIAVSEKRKVPLLCLNSGEEITFPLPARKFTYKLGPNAADVGAMIARELVRQQISTVAVLASADGHGSAGANAVPRSLAAAGLQHVGTVRLPQSGRAFTDAAKQVVASKAKAAVVWALAPISAAAVAALRDAGFLGKIFVDAGAGADETLSGPNAAAMEGTYIIHPAVLGGAPTLATTPSGRAARDFIYRYIQQYGAFSGFAPYAADALNLVAFAARRGVNLEPQRLRGRLEAGAVEGITGAYAFQPISHGGLEPDALVLFTAKGGNWVRLL